MRKVLSAAGPTPVVQRPFFSIWQKPETTIRRIVHENPGYRLLAWPLIASLAYSPFLTSVGLVGEDDDFYGLVWGSLLSHGPLLELAQLYIGAWVLRVIGARFGGRGQSTDLQVVIAWANVPIVCLVVAQCLVWVPVIIVQEAAGGAALYVSQVVEGALGCLELGAIAASMAMLVRGVAAVHGIRIPAALWTVLSGWLASVLMLSVVVSMLWGVPYLRFFIFGPLVL